MRKLSAALSVAVVAAGVFAAPVGGGSTVTKPTVQAKQAPAKPVRLCKQF
jgi:hypothetical protein